ncbi:hypothetical protein [Candidatus Thalassarchaeum betae]|uniref:hypothetical protein n=1 Tax=Candidatus Thalassarchaeum betae TaxID=2599289 RepID=UPI0030C75BB0|nr:hypothetical protein [Candidatus Thalassoarchaea betae]
MNGQANDTVTLLYRKRPEPCRVVSLATLRRTNGPVPQPAPTTLVSSAGVVSEADSWGPMPRMAAQINVSPSSWAGLRERLHASCTAPTVVA